MKEFLDAAKALSDEGRLRALMALAGGELCLCQTIELLGLAPSTVSKHMAVLHQAGLVETRKEGRWTYHHLPAEPAPAAGALLAAARDALAGDARVRRDAARLKSIRKTDPGDLCDCYHEAGTSVSARGGSRI
jgi:DNA-binding transcriptional ArsR family regulator